MKQKLDHKIGHKISKKVGHKISEKIIQVLCGAVVIVAILFIGAVAANAETNGGSPDSGVTSKIKTLYTAITTLNQGSDAAGSWGDWGAYWNRIYTAVTLEPKACSTQQYNADHASATAGNNCSLTWTTNPTPVTGDDNKAGRGGLDPRTGLTWSQYLKNTTGTVGFAASAGSTWNWNSDLVFTVTSANATAGATYTNNGQTFTVVTTIAPGTSLTTTPTGAAAASGTLTKATGTGDATITFSATGAGTNNVAVGLKTASLLCSERGSGWRLPTEKELMQSYIDGSYWNLTNPSYYFWASAENSATSAWLVSLSYGTTYYTNKSTSSTYVRCVR